MVARSKPAHSFTDLLNNASAFVATNNGQSERQITCGEMLVGVAHSRCGDFD
jgi:hypothetical protein